MIILRWAPSKSLYKWKRAEESWEYVMTEAEVKVMIWERLNQPIRTFKEESMSQRMYTIFRAEKGRKTC